jgi:hypothetical protein
VHYKNQRSIIKDHMGDQNTTGAVNPAATAPAGYDFASYKKDALDRPSSKAWGNWWKAEKVNDMVQGFIVDVFYRKASGVYKDARGITLKQKDGKLVNVSVKRIDFILAKTNNLRLGDPLTVVFEEEVPSNDPKNKPSPTKVYGYYGTNLAENAGNPTVAELDEKDRKAGGMDDDTAKGVEGDDFA